MTRKLIVMVVSIFLLIGCVMPLAAEIPNPLTVAFVPDLYPISFLNDDGKPDGAFPRVIEKIARQNNIILEWSVAGWAENLESARNGEIDLMIALTYTEERDGFLEYGSQSVLSTWSQLFQAREGVVNSILDVDGRRVGMMIGDQNARAFVDLAESFNISYQSFYFDNFDQIYKELVDGSIDTGVFYSLYNLSQPDLIPTSIIFQPNNAYFAIPEGADDEILRLIDQTLLDWKADDSSYYFRKITSLFSVSSVWILHQWLKILLPGLILLILFILLWLWLLKRLVRRRTAALVNAQNIYKSTFMEADIGICHVDTEGRIFRVNPGFCSYLGYDEQTLLRKRISDFTHPDDMDEKGELYKELNEGKRKSFNIDKRFIARDGNVLWGHLTASAIRDSIGKTQYMVGLIVDITALKNAESMVYDLQKRYRGVFENSYQMTALFDDIGKFVDINDTLKRAFGLIDAEDNLIGLTPVDIELLGPIGSLRIQEMVEECLSTGQTIRHMIGFEETGVGRAMDVTVKPILGKNRKIRYCVMEAHDVTDMMKLTNNLEQQVEERTRDIREAQQRLVESDKMASLGRLVAGIAHEINTPVGVAKTGASFLKEQVDETRKKFEEQTLSKEEFSTALDSFGELSVILEQNLDRAIKLIRDFKMTSADQSSRELRIVSIKEYIEAVMHSLNPRFKKTEIKWSVEAPDEEVQLHVGAINQILINLTINSLSHAFVDGEAGQISIVFHREKDRRILEVRDNGRGIPSDIRDRIFEPFFTTGRGKGYTGLGLSIIYSLVKDVLGGDIECESREGEGTTFRISCPEIGS